MSKNSDIQVLVNKLYQLDKEQADLKAALDVVSTKIRAFKAEMMKEIKANQLKENHLL